MYEALLNTIKEVCDLLSRRGYKPVLVGSVALVLHGWLPRWFLDRTKDIDIYVDAPLILFDTDIDSLLMSKGYSIGRNEVGGIYIETGGKLIEIVYPLYDFFVPRALLKYTVDIHGIRVLEPHAVLVAMALGHSITAYAEYLKDKVDVKRLETLVREVREEVDADAYRILKKRISEFISELERVRQGVSVRR